MGTNDYSYSPETIRTFIHLVAGMRRSQNKYLSNRTQPSLLEARQKERQVDGFLIHFAELAVFSSVGEVSGRVQK
jgi:hypothetical protein